MVQSAFKSTVTFVRELGVAAIDFFDLDDVSELGPCLFILACIGAGLVALWLGT
ncbi:hypothetical protein [Tardiphaga alba]|uniref:hypothetical protein n=1 Tax=Tardiphaga alba TaxID=340268 RepID=UPI001BA4F4F5|nr:hypothetical protein [Tardiphaga alba]